MEKKREIRLLIPRMARNREKQMWILCGAVPTQKANRLVVEIPLGSHEYNQRDFLVKVMLIKIGALYRGDVLVQRLDGDEIVSNEYVTV